MNTEQKRKPGRPKTLKRDHVIGVAMENYWTEGPANVSINEICKIAGVSKPGIYREFGNEDGLQEAVLTSYFDIGVKPLFGIFTKDQHFSDGVEAVINLFIQLRSIFSSPRGCLFRDMHHCQDQLGKQTNEIIDLYHQQILEKCADWIERAKSRKEIRINIPTEIAANYVDLQMINAMTLLKRDETDEIIRDIMKLSFSVFY